MAFSASSAGFPSLFDTPDRHTPSRSPTRQTVCTLRTSRKPNNLNSRERYARQRDHSYDPFRSCSDSSPRPKVKHQVTADHTGIGTLAPHYVPSFVRVYETTATEQAQDHLRDVRYVSLGNVWSVGGRAAAVPSPLEGIDTGTGDVMASGTNAPMVTAQFLECETEEKKRKLHEARLALALDIDQASRVLPLSPPLSPEAVSPRGRRHSLDWIDSAWRRGPSSLTRSRARKQINMKLEKTVPSVAFRVLDAPRLKDDFYCSVLAYYYPSRTLAVALTHRVYLWTEVHGVRYPPLPPARLANYVSSLAFSSTHGGKGVLAIARNSGHVTLWSLFEQKARFEAPHPWAVCSVAFRPTTATRQMAGAMDYVECEDLLVGDDSGCLYYYSVHWPEFAAGSMALLTKLDAHSQNICGLAWSPDGRTFVSGGNDNAALLFEVSDILNDLSSGEGTSDDEEELDQIIASGMLTPPASPLRGSNSSHIMAYRDGLEQLATSNPTVYALGLLTPFGDNEPEDRQGLRQNLENHLASPGIDGRPMMHKRAFYHSAAVKAIAYAPWQPTLIATGGGSNDRQIHFHHTESGSTLAVINVFAQVTSLSWSSTSREIVATFGYAQPEHDIRIAVFAWPGCECVVSIPWERKPNGEIGRALWAIPYPGGPNDAAPTKEAQEGADANFHAWETVQARQAHLRAGVETFDSGHREVPERSHQDDWSERPAGTVRIREQSRAARTEGEAWASRTEEEGSLIIACCDQTVKFFEVWAGKSKGRSMGIGAKAGVLGGSKVLEGWCEGVCVDEVDIGVDIR